MNKLIYTKKILILLGIFILIALVISIMLFRPSYKSAAPISFNIEPIPGTILPLDKIPIFALTSSKSLTQDDQIDIKQQLASSDSATEVRFSTQKEPGSNTVILTLNTLPIPFSIYTVTVKDNSNNTQLFIASFDTDQPTPTPISANNPNLAKYLPYETTNYKLSYDQSQNLYIFNFKYDPVSSIPSLDQYNQAKSDALNFIKSKGIDPNSVVIDWRHS